MRFSYSGASWIETIRAPFHPRAERQIRRCKRISDWNDSSLRPPRVEWSFGPSVNSVYIREKFDIIHGHIPWEGISRLINFLTFQMCKSSLSWRKLPWCMFANALTSTMYRSYGHVAHGHTSLAIRMVILFLCISPGYLPQGHIYPALLIFTLNTDILIFNIPRVYNV